MNEWLTDPRAELAEERAYAAECAEHDPVRARELYREAAGLYASVALSVSPDHPHTRSALGIAAVACHARAGDHGRAVDVAHRLLAQRGALSERGRAELTRMAQTYAALIAPKRFPTKRSSGRRDELRSSFSFRKEVA